jgi:hypothetical protein
MYLDASRVGFDYTTLQMPGPALGHLAAAGVAGTQKKDSQFFFHWLL